MATRPTSPATRPGGGPPVDEAIPEGRLDIGAQLRDPGRYYIMGEHGRGGLGRVSRAHDRELGRDVAIKELIARGHVDEIRFLREALITARLEHPGIVPVHEAGRWPDGTPFYAMKLVSGRSLRDLIAEATTSDQRIGLIDHVIAVADAIAYAHGRNIIHRDLKPANVIVGEFGEVVVIDWGLAKDLTAAEEPPTPKGPSPPPAPGDDDLTVAGSVLGTPAYMAPEQGRGEQVDRRADVFAIGTMLWELCASRKVPPEDAGGRHALLRRAGIDRDLATIINKALDPDPARRYLHAGALASDLKAFKSGVRIAARSYSLFAMLAHWTRRHRPLAISVTTAVLLAAAGVVVFVRNIAAERDRADAALTTAQQERDRAKLSESSLQLEKDPTRSRDLLAALTLRNPRYALLTSRARTMSAVQRVPLAAGIAGLSRAPSGATAEVITPGGELFRLDPATGALDKLDRDVTGPVVYRGGQRLYARKPLGARSVRIATPSDPGSIVSGDLTSVSRVAALNDAVYVLDTSGDLHRLDGKTSTVIEHGVHNIVGDGDLRIVCKSDGELDVVRGDAIVLQRRCPPTKSPATMAVVRDDYVALTSDGTLTAMRHGRQLEARTDLLGEYELALSSQGVIAIADYSGSARTWFVRPDGSGLEPGPVHASPPYSVAADGALAAWGYTDGTVIVLETTTGMTWTFRGHPDSISYVVVDAARAQAISASDHELRVWRLKPRDSSLVKSMPCAGFHIEPSPDGTRVAVDCTEGSVWTWSRDTGVITQVHKHAGFAFGAQWVSGMICSGGRGDGRVLCSTPDGTYTRVLDSGTTRINWLTATPDHRSLIFASSDGKIWRFDSTLRELYAHAGAPTRMAISPDGYLLASCAIDGSLAVYDLVNRKVVAHLIGHAGVASCVKWEGDELWTSGNDGTLKRWAIRDGSLTLRHSVQMSGAYRWLSVANGGWAANVGDGVLLVSRDGVSLALRLDIGRAIETIDVSPDLRYVAAGVAGEIIVVDMQRNAVATTAIDSRMPQQVSFVDAASLTFGVPAALYTLQVDRLDYVPFEPAPEPPNRASF